MAGMGENGKCRQGNAAGGGALRVPGNVTFSRAVMRNTADAEGNTTRRREESNGIRMRRHENVAGEPGWLAEPGGRPHHVCCSVIRP